MDCNKRTEHMRTVFSSRHYWEVLNWLLSQFFGYPVHLFCSNCFMRSAENKGTQRNGFGKDDLSHKLQEKKGDVI